MREFAELYEILNRLRDPKDGCPWDLKQTSQSLISNFIEELYETVEAIENNDHEHLQEELGDLLLHIVFQAKIAEENGLFSMREVLESVNSKLKRRHPHVFATKQSQTSSIDQKDNTSSNIDGDETELKASEVKINWERIKLQEKTRNSVLEGIPKNLPALIYSHRMQEKAASVGFDWVESADVLDKISEEISELRMAIETQKLDEVEEEIGDLFFTLVNYARKLGIDSETSLRKASKKFQERFQRIEKYHSERGENIYNSSMEKLDELWEISKKGI